jgi:hypothetical protein
MPTTPQNSPSSLGTGVNSGAEDSKQPHYHHWLRWLASKAGMWRHGKWGGVGSQYGYMGTAPYVVTKPLILQPLIFPPCGTVRAPLSCARTHHEARGQVVVAMGRLSVYLQRQATLMDHYQRRCGVPNFLPHTPLPSNYCLVRLDFGAATPSLFPPAPRARK